MAVKTTYRDVRRAWYALSALASGQLMNGDRNYSPELKIKTNLRIKRMMGNLRVLMEQMGEEEKRVMDKFPDWDKNPATAPKELNDLLGEIYDTECTVGSDRLSEADFDHLDTAPTVLIGVLVDLGPFFDDGELTGKPSENGKVPSEVPAPVG